MVSFTRTVVAAVFASTVAGCSFLPASWTNATDEPRGDDEFRQDYETCAARSAGSREETRVRLGTEFTASDPADPMSPDSIAATRSNLELSQCMQAKGWSGAGE